jgi:ribonuclease P protein component
LATTQPYTLGKNDKLKSRKSIEQLFKEGKSFSNFPFRVLYLQAATGNLHGEFLKGHLQTAFSVSKRYFKKAVDRNRIKRLMREGWRLQKNELLNNCKTSNTSLLVFIIYTGNELPEYTVVFEKIGIVIKRLQKMNNETVASNM